MEKIAPQIDIWYYPMEWLYDIASAPSTLNVYYDMKSLAETDCRGVFVEAGLLWVMNFLSLPIICLEMHVESVYVL